MKKRLAMIVAGVLAVSAGAGELYVLAGAGLMDVLKAVDPLYGKTRSGVKFTLVYGATGMLRAQILKTAEAVAVFSGLGFRVTE